MRREGAIPAGIAVLVLAVAAPAWARRPALSDAPAGATKGAGEERAILDLIVNEQEQGTAFVVLSSDDALVPVEALTSAGLHGFGGTRSTVEGVEYVSLASLRPEIGFRLDERELSLRVMADPKMLGHFAFDLRDGVRPANLELHRDRSAFVNYSAQIDSAGALAAFGELGASVGGNLLYSGVSRLPDGTVVRGVSNFTVDEPSSLRRWIAGDSVQSGTLLGGGAALIGLAVQREYSLDPYFVRSPLPASRGFATTPSTMEVYVNGQLVRTERIAPGSFEVMNLPLSSGDGSYRTVIRDAFGRVTETGGQYYYSSGVLAKGLHEYGYAAGFQRRDFGTSSFDYGPPAFLGRHRYGFTDALTAGGRLEATPGLVSGGLLLTARAPLGEIELGAAASGGSHRQGAAASASWLYASHRFSVGALVRWQSPFYATTSLPPELDRPLVQGKVFATLPLFTRLILNGEIQAARARDGGDALRFALRTDVPVGSRGSVSLSAARTAGTQTQTEVFAGFTWYFGDRTTGTAGMAGSGAGFGSNASIQRSREEGPGVAYRVRYDRSPGVDSGEGELLVQGDHGRVEGVYQRAAGSELASVNGAGSVVLIGGDVFLSRPIQDGYALLQVPGVGGVRGLVNNQLAGTTNARGNLLVPNLLPYYGNKLSIDVTDVPLDHDVDGADRFVATPLRGGAVVRFATRRLKVVKGQLVIAAGDGRQVPSYGEVSLSAAGVEWTSPIASDGRFWLEGVPAGTHRARIVSAAGGCEAELRVPDSAAQEHDLGRIPCAPISTVAER